MQGSFFVSIFLNLAHLHKQLTGVIAAEEAEERLRGILQALDHGLTIFQFAFCDPLAKLLQRCVFLKEVIISKLYNNNEYRSFGGHC